MIIGIKLGRPPRRHPEQLSANRGFSLSYCVSSLAGAADDKPWAIRLPKSKGHILRGYVQLMPAQSPLPPLLAQALRLIRPL